LQPIARVLEPKVMVSVALFVMAWCLESRHLWNTLLRPWPAVWAVFISYGPLPALAWLAGLLLDVADFRIGLVIVASVPCTLASAVLWTRMARGNEATALLVTLMTTGTSWLATTGWLFLATGAHVGMDVGSLMVGLFLVLVLPVGAGQLFQTIPALAQFAIRFKTGFGVVSKILIFSIIFRAAVEMFDKLEGGTVSLSTASIVAMIVACLAVHLIGLTIGFWTSRALRFDRPNQIAVAIASSQKSLPVALLLYQTYAESYPLAVIPLAIYHMGQLIVDTVIAERMAEGHRDKIEKPDEAQVLT